MAWECTFNHKHLIVTFMSEYEASSLHLHMQICNIYACGQINQVTKKFSSLHAESPGINAKSHYKY